MLPEEFLKYEGKLVLPKEIFGPRELYDLDLIVGFSDRKIPLIKLKCLSQDYIYECHENYIKHNAYIINYNQNIVDMYLNESTMHLAIEIIKNEYRNTLKVT